MTPEEFLARWKLSTLGERQAAQLHFGDLCDLLGQPKPDDPETYCFEKGATKTRGGRGWCDVWKKGHFAWEYKGKRGDLPAAIAQLQQYALALDNPPLLVACDLERFLIVTNWTNTPSKRIELHLEQLVTEPKARDTLLWVLSDPEKLRPGLTRQMITAAAAREFVELARDLRARGHHPERVARYLVRLVFCMFAEDIGLLPNNMLSRMLDECARTPDDSEALGEELFRVMATGGRVGYDRVKHFDGGLFETDGEPLALPLDRPQARAALAAARKDWADIDPSILGTLFVQALDPKRMEDLFRVARSHDPRSVSFRKSFEQYTDADKIMKIIEPVIQRPLEAEWQARLAEIESLLLNGKGAARAQAVYREFVERLGRFKVLDPACGSGNFLFLALQTLKDLEHKAGLEAEAHGLQREFLRVRPAQMLGIEINPFAVELARASVWIGELQWWRRQGLIYDRQPILEKLDTIERRDALLKDDGTEAEWPEAEVIIGNPPFLGGKRLRDGLGDASVDRLFQVFAERVPPEADLVCYWFAKASEAIEAGSARRAGLVATNSIRGGANRRVLDRLRERQIIFDAWDDEEWNVEGAAVRVSLVSFAAPGDPAAQQAHLDGRAVDGVFSDLSATIDGNGVDLTQACRLVENRGVAFMGDTKGGAFDVSGDLARKWLTAPLNPNRQPNSNVLRPWRNGLDVTRRPRDMWIIDFGWEMTQEQAAYYELPFGHLVRYVHVVRQRNNRGSYKRYWWRHVEPRPAMWGRLRSTSRYVVTPTVTTHRLFAWLGPSVCPDHQLIVIARDDDTTFGILHSRIHELWTLRLCTWLGVGNDPRYTPSTTFETFPFPEGLTPNLPAAAYADDPRAKAIAAAAKRLNDLREAWLNPPDLVVRVPEVVPGYPDRILPKDAEAAKELRKRTLTNLYNARPAWLDHAHRELDAAVAAAYGWPADLADDAILKRLFELNQERARAGR
jgi:hypothetical protein